MALKKQIISPFIRYGASSRGPYANRLGQGRYAKSFGRRDVPDFIAFDARNGVIKALIKGEGSVTFERQTEATIEDHEGLIQECLPHEIRVENARRVENLETHNTNTPVYLTPGGATPPTINKNATFQGRNCASITFPSGVSGYGGSRANFEETGSGLFPIESGNDYVGNTLFALSRPLDGSEQISLLITGSQSFGSETYSATHQNDYTSWTRVITGDRQQTTVDGNNFLSCYPGQNLSSPLTVYITERQCEKVTGQSNQNPSEYVSVGVGTGAEQITDVTAWTTGAGWTDNGVDSISAATATANCSKDLGLIENKTYVITYTATVSAGTFRTLVGGTAGTTRTASGTYIDVVVCGSTNTELAFDGVTSFTGSITGISIKEADHGLFVDGVKAFAYENGNTVDGDKVVTEAKGAALTDWRFLFEPASENVLLQSSNFTTGAGDWTTSGSVQTASTTTSSPVQGRDWWRLEANSTTSGNRHVFSNTHTKAAVAENWVASAIVKEDQFTEAQIQAENGVKFFRARINLSTGAVSGLTGSVWTAVSAGREALQNGSYRVWVKGTTDTDTGIRLRVDLIQGGSDFVTPGAVGDGIFLQGAQLEKAEVVTYLIETSGTAVTRTADNALSMFDYANWSQTEGTVIATIRLSDVNIGSQQGILCIGITTANIFYETSGTVITNDGTNFSLRNITANNENKILSEYSTNANELYLGIRDVGGVGPWSYGTTVAYDGGFPGSGDLSMFFPLSRPMRIKDLKFYTTRKGKEWVEKNE